MNKLDIEIIPRKKEWFRNKPFLKIEGQYSPYLKTIVYYSNNYIILFITLLNKGSKMDAWCKNNIK